jgi:ketosteroid isomerase-like protein
LIGAKDYRGAYALREQREGAGFAAFAANYERYSAYHATVGQPSQTAAAGDCLYVEVPVQYYGQTKDGKAFGSAGTITLRRHKANGGWRIHTPGARGTVFIYDDQGERRRAC